MFAGTAQVTSQLRQTFHLHPAQIYLRGIFLQVVNPLPTNDVYIYVIKGMTVRTRTSIYVTMVGKGLKMPIE